MYPVKKIEYYRDHKSEILEYTETAKRKEEKDRNLLPDIITCEAVLALCQLIQLRNAYNGEWVPDWTNNLQNKYAIYNREKEIEITKLTNCGEILYFKTAELRDEFLRNFRPLIEKLKPLYGIKTGGEE